MLRVADTDMTTPKPPAPPDDASAASATIGAAGLALYMRAIALWMTYRERRMDSAKPLCRRLARRGRGAPQARGDGGGGSHTSRA
jgi:hypothetical protein